MSYSIGFIGIGKVAATLAVALSRAGYRITAVASRSFSSAQNLAALLEGCKAYENKQAVADACDLVFITTPDDAIPEVAAELRWRPDQAVVHCSGADSSATLSAASDQGAAAGVFHPLQSFAGGSDDTSRLKGITFSIEAAEPLLSRLKDMAEALGGRWVVLSAEDKVLYHAAAVIACNYMVTLVSLATGLWSKFGVDGKDATAALLPLMKGTLANIENVGLPDCLTGPIARGDTGTVIKHLKAIHTRAPEIEAAYRTLGLATIPVALSKGRLGEDRAGQISAALQDKETK